MLRVARFLGRAREKTGGFTALIGAVYFAFLCWMHAHHEMWRDEIHAWTIARQAKSFLELVTGDRVYDGHPPLWYWYLHVWTWFTQSALGMQAATVVAATAASILFLRFAPFPRYLKVLLLFSYYVGYEYTVLSRDYVLGWLLLCLFCACYDRLRSHPLRWALLIALLALTSAYGMVIAVALVLFLLLDNTRFRRSSEPPGMLSASISPWVLAGVVIAGVGIVFSAAVTEPPDPNPFSPGWNLPALSWDALPAMLTRLVAGFLPLRRPGRDFWLSPFTLWQDPAWTPYVGVGLLLVTVLSLYPAWRIMLVYLVGVLGMEVFQQVRYVGDTRHWGHYFLFLIVGTWLTRASLPRRRFLLSTLCLLGIIAFQVQGFLSAVVSDTRWVFSGGRETADFIRHAGLQDLPLIAGPDGIVLVVSGYLRRPFIRVETDEFHATIDFHSRRRGFSPRELVDRAASVSHDEHGPVLVLSNEALPRPRARSRMSLLFVSRRATIGDETFWVYSLTAQ